MTTSIEHHFPYYIPPRQWKETDRVQCFPLNEAVLVPVHVHSGDEYVEIYPGVCVGMLTGNK